MVIKQNPNYDLSISQLFLQEQWVTYIYPNPNIQIIQPTYH